MPPFIPVPNVVQLTAIYTLNGEICENVFHYQFAARPTVLDMNNLIDAFKTWEQNHAAAARQVNAYLVRVKAVDMTVQGAPGVDRQIIPAIEGTDPGGPLPNNVTLAIAFRTGLAGRSFRGRCYHIGLAAGNVTQNTVHDTHVTSLTQIYTLLLNVDPAGSPPLVVVSKYSQKLPRNPGIATPITAVTINNITDSQRRRLPEHNRHR